MIALRSWIAPLAVLVLGACAAQQERSVVHETERVTLAPAPLPKYAEEKDWRPYFRDLSKGAILIQTEERRLTYWGPDGESYMEFPVAVGRSPDFEKRGRSKVVRKRADPDWTPTPAMRRRDPSLPAYVPPGPDNPMGEHAIYLDWTYYAIHGTNDPLSIGRAASSGCFRLFPEHVEQLFSEVAVGTPVYVE